MAGLLKRVAAERVSGQRPSVFRAAVAAGAAGAAAAALTYKVLRA
jgi:hypothetical protein